MSSSLSRASRRRLHAWTRLGCPAAHGHRQRHARASFESTCLPVLRCLIFVVLLVTYHSTHCCGGVADQYKIKTQVPSQIQCPKFVPWHRGPAEYNLTQPQMSTSRPISRGSGGYPQPPEAKLAFQKSKRFSVVPRGLAGIHFLFEK